MRIVFHLFGSLGDVWPYANLCRELQRQGVSTCILGPGIHLGAKCVSGLDYIACDPDIPQDMLPEYLNPDTADVALNMFLSRNAGVGQLAVSKVLRQGDILAYSTLTPGAAGYATVNGIRSVLCFHSPTKVVSSAGIFQSHSRLYPYKPEHIFLMYPKEFCGYDETIPFPITQSCYPMNAVRDPNQELSLGATLGSVVKDQGRFFKSFREACKGLIPMSDNCDRSYIVAHHGGIGTTLKYSCLRRRQIIIPHMWDQPQNAELAARLGAIVIPYKYLCPETARLAIVAALNTPPEYLPWGSIKKCATDFRAALGLN